MTDIKVEGGPIEGGKQQRQATYPTKGTTKAAATNSTNTSDTQ